MDRASIISGTLYSSNGTITYNLQSGKVMSIDQNEDSEDNKYFPNISIIDVKEYRKYYRQPVPQVLDILMVGYYLTDGTYEPPAQDWRDEIDRARRDI